MDTAPFATGITPDVINNLPEGFGNGRECHGGSVALGADFIPATGDSLRFND